MDGSVVIQKTRGWTGVRPFRRGLPRLWLVLKAGVRANEPTSLALAATAVLSIYFLIFPDVDLAMADLFHNATQGFAASNEPVLKVLRKSSTFLLAPILIVALFQILRGSVRKRSLAFACARRAWFMLVGLVIGPGLVVNVLLKNEWGRPRPVQVESFGGDAPYVPVWQISDWCDRNCSFVSGEASSAAWMVAALVLVPERWRRIVAVPVVIYAVALSLNRVAFGGHFLSDVMLSWAITAVIMASLHRLMVASPGAARRARRVRTFGLTTAR